MISLALSALCLATLGSAQEARDTDPAQNLAFGKPVTFLPAPNYSGTAKADTDETDLTDGRLTEREDEHMWFETLAVGYSYGGRVNLALDLGEVQPIDEVAIRLLGGSVQAGITAPGWVEVLVADDEAGPYYRVAEYSRFTPGDREDYGVPRNEGTGWIWRLSFDDLNTRGRYVGLRLYSGGLSCSDEMYVFKGDHDASDVTFDESDLTDFTVHGAQLHFHKPVVHVTSNIVTPVPVGIVAETIDTESPMTISMTLPEGAEIAGGGLGGVSVDEADVDGRTYTWTIDTKGSSTKTFGRLYMTGSPEEDGPEITYQLTWGAHQSPVISIPVESIEIPEQPIIPKRLMTSLSWWSVGATMAWPDWQSAFEALGLNTLPASSTWFDPEDQETIDFVASARDAGYRIQTIDSTWHRMLGRRKGESEIYCQFEDGTSGKQLCPSYRGEFHDEELGRVAAAVSILQPTWFHDDIELWGWRGPQDPEKCTRCIADKADTGIETWDEWKLAKGEEMWRELYETVQEALADAGAPKCDMSVYDFRPGRAYQYFWPFDRLYPEV
ncbi:MAG TPA: hypothetical protein QGH10_04740, partial [Armatimonadota bacterium]|nr:hypothetical protein [Armatimonadota bacterium]